MNPKELRKKTDAAVRRGVEKAEAEERQKREQERLRLENAKAWVASRMAEIPLTAEAAAEARQSRCVVASTRDFPGAVKIRPSLGGDWQAFPGWDTSEINGLQFRMLCEALEAAEFKVDVVYDHDGVGMYSWFEVYISW